MAAELPYALNTGNIAPFFKAVQETGRPPKLTIKHLESMGFTSKNDRALVAFVKALGFIDSSGTPTDRWTAYKDSSRAPTIMAEGLREAYGGLFRLHPDAQNKDDEAIRNWMRTASPGASASTIKRSLGSFRAVAALANFNSTGGDVAAPSAGTPDSDVVAPAAIHTPAPQLTRAGGPTINLNIELHIAATENADVYDKFFAAMRKHLFPEDE